MCRPPFFFSFLINEKRNSSQLTAKKHNPPIFEVHNEDDHKYKIYKNVKKQNLPEHKNSLPIECSNIKSHYNPQSNWNKKNTSELNIENILWITPKS